MSSSNKKRVRVRSTPEGAKSPSKRGKGTRTGAQSKRAAYKGKVRTPRSLLSDWVLVRTKTGQENWARVNCKQQDMETWLPRCEIPGMGKLQPLFPGYLFVKPGDKWRALRNTYGVIDILSRGGKPEYVPKKVIRDLMKRADKEGIVKLPYQRKPKLGERVQIKVGAFQDCFGLYDGLSPEGRIRVLTEFMSQMVTLEFNREHHIEVADIETHEG